MPPDRLKIGSILVAVRLGESLYRAFEVVADHIRNVRGPRMWRRPAGVRHDELSEGVGMPGFYRRSLVGKRKGSKDRVAGLDLGEITFDDLRLLALRLASEIPPHWVNGLPSDLANESFRASTVLLGVGRAGKIHPPHSGTRCRGKRVMGLQYVR